MTHRGGRRCNVCGGSLLAVPPDIDRGHNCASLGSLLVGSPPEQCWLRSSSERDYELVRALGATRRDRRAETQLQAALQRAALAIRSAPLLDNTALQALREATGDRLVPVCRHMIRNLPQDSAFADFLLQIPDVPSRDAHTIAGAVKVVEACDDVRPEFRRVLEGFLRASIRRFETKRDRGHDYSQYTVYRRVLVAADFCRFLEGQGVLSWQEVMQRHLDAFCAARTREQGQRVYPFLVHARRVAPVSAKLRSPRSRRRPTLELAPSFEAHERAVASLIAAPVDEAILVGLFVAVYVQRISDCGKLHLSHFRVRDDRVQARFAEEWMPLDRAVAARVLSIAPDVADGIRREDRALFTLGPRSYSRRIRAICNLPIKKLRLGALAARAPKRWKMSFPPALPVSIFSFSDSNPIPRASRPLTVATRCRIERPSRSRRQTTSLSSARSIRRHSSSFGRSARVPDTLSTKISSHPASFSASTWRSGD